MKSENSWIIPVAIPKFEDALNIWAFQVRIANRLVVRNRLTSWRPNVHSYYAVMLQSVCFWNWALFYGLRLGLLKLNWFTHEWFFRSKCVQSIRGLVFYNLGTLSKPSYFPLDFGTTTSQIWKWYFTWLNGWHDYNFIMYAKRRNNFCKFYV